MNDNNISNLVLATLGNLLEDGVNLTNDPVAVANAIANELTVASWQQLAAVTGASVETDNDGQLVLYTGCYQKADNDIKAGTVCTELLNEEDAGWADPF